MEAQLLPFSFHRMENGRFLLVNQGGEYSFLSLEEFDKFLSGDPNVIGNPFLRYKQKQLVCQNESDLDVELLSTKLRTRKAFLTAFTTLHMIVVTARCNCFCDYCHASSLDPDKENYDMSLDVAKKTIDMIFQTPSPTVKIEFQGGEPLLNWDVIKEAVLYAKEVNKRAKKNLEFVICTNLILATDEIIGFCKQEDIMLSSSLDGPKEFHDSHRKTRDGSSSYDQFVTNLAKVRKEIGHNGCAALLTITRDNLHRLPEVIDHYVELGFTGVFLRALNPYGYAVKNFGDIGYTTEEFVKAFGQALDYITDLNRRGFQFTEYYTSLLLQRILTPFSTGFVDLQSPSGAGISGVIYDYNGEVYPADEARMLARMGDKKFLMGNVMTDSFFDVFYGDVIQDIVYNSCVEVMPSCASCAYQLYCGADPIRNYVETGDIVGSRPESGFCKKNKGIFDIIFKLIDEGDEDVMNLFWAWATRRGLGDVRLESR